MKKLPAEQAQYHAVSGVAGGAVNAVLLASQPSGSEQTAAEQMQKFWLDAGNNKLYQEWYGGVVTGLLLKGGLYDNSPLKDFLKKEIPEANI